MVQFTENTWKLKKPNYFSWKKSKIREKETWHYVKL